MLPDDLGLALIGHCCAVEAAGKATVGMIERRTESLFRKAGRQREVEAVAAGLPELLQLLDDKYASVEQEIDHVAGELRGLLPRGLDLPRPTKLGIAAGGLVSILDRVTRGNLSDADILALLDKREKAKTLIRSGLTELAPAVTGLNVNVIRRDMRTLRQMNGLDLLKV